MRFWSSDWGGSVFADSPEAVAAPCVWPAQAHIFISHNHDHDEEEDHDHDHDNGDGDGDGDGDAKILLMMMNMAVLNLFTWLWGLFPHFRGDLNTANSSNYFCSQDDNDQFESVNSLSGSGGQS